MSDGCDLKMTEKEIIEKIKDWLVERTLEATNNNESKFAVIRNGTLQAFKREFMKEE